MYHEVCTPTSQLHSVNRLVYILLNIDGYHCVSSYCTVVLHCLRAALVLLLVECAWTIKDIVISLVTVTLQHQKEHCQAEA